MALKTNLTFKEVEAILLDDKWPALPFLSVAQAQGKTRQRLQQDGQAYRHLKDMKNLQRAQDKNTDAPQDPSPPSLQPSQCQEASKNKTFLLQKSRVVASSLAAVMMRKQNYELPLHRAKELLDSFRCHGSKEFFKAAKTVIKSNKTATIAKAFRTDDPLVTTPIEQYIETHFRDSGAAKLCRTLTLRLR